ncbi:sacsin N-terminal ATP-binding-like domain-containing protein [Frankia sp. AgB32]|uniref:sacsin N-terminal ATP-binding-like domain-containing protein n=1 Tax=Frankia sp. AgB32 TaxID=631119 RepID=UPI00200FD494|nr:molecular chaperone Hsp90 [Frankia sp. AgB32]MCK9895104.1 molecular chaperone Hsp90 [Frankia sp. AgB32]
MTTARAAADGYGTDRYGADAIRRRVLDSWGASPARFREDANAEEDAALGAYRDRLVVELLQNALDAAREAGVPARTYLRLTTLPTAPGAGPGGLLEVANTGAPLSAAGVEALSTLRASSKRDTTAIGRFGAGFAAVLAVTDEPSIVSAVAATDQPATDQPATGVAWSRTAAIDAVTALRPGLHQDVDNETRRDVTNGDVTNLDPATEGGGATGGPATGLAAELARRDGAAPILRLPFAITAPPPPPGYDTVVRLPLRDAAAAELARTLLGGLDPTLPLVLGGPGEITVDVDGEMRTITCRWIRGGPDGERADPGGQNTPRQQVAIADLNGERWRGVARLGTIPARLLADRPVEERQRTGFTARAMVPDGDWPDGVARVLRAPQPTDEPLSLPVLASVELPLDPSRRHTIAGPLRDWLTDELAAAIVALAACLGTGDALDEPAQNAATDSGAARSGVARIGAPDPRTALAIVPTGLPRGEVDGRLRDVLLRQLPEAALFPGGRRGWECSVCDLGPATDAVTELLGEPADTSADGPTDGIDDGIDDAALVPGLLPASYASRRWRSALDLLGVRRVDSATLVELLSGATRPPHWWGRIYSLLVSAPDRDALGALPVPLAEVMDEDAALGVRMVTGPRGTLLPTPDLDIVALVRSGLPLRVVHPEACADAARDALRTLGAVEGTPAGVLRDPAVREAVLDADPDDHPDDLLALAGAVLALARDAGEEATGLDWLEDLLLPSADGEFATAGELLVAGGPLDQVLDEDAPFSTLSAELARAWPAEVLERVGVLHSFGVLRAYDLPLDADEQILLDLDDSDTWVDDVAAGDHGAPGDSVNLRRPPAGGPPAPAMIGVFTAVRDLELVNPRSWPQALAHLARPPLREVVFTPEPSYTRWWLARHAVLPVLGGPALPPRELLLATADPLLAGLFAPAAPLDGVDDDFLRHLGARLTLDDVLGDLGAVMDLLDRLGDADREIPWAAARILYIAAVDAVARMLAAPHRTARDERFDPPLTVRTPDGVVPGEQAVVVDAPDLLRLVGGRGALRLPLDRAAEVAHVLGVPLAAETGPCDVVSTAEESGRAPDGTPYLVHRPLLVEDLSGRPTPVPWRVVGGIGGEVHVDAQAGPDALARALAWRGGQWDRRHALAAELRDPHGAAFRGAEDDLDET